MVRCPSCRSLNLEGAETCEECGADLTELSRPRARSPVEKSLHKGRVGDLRDHPPVVVPPERKIRDVIASLVHRRDGCAVVADASGKVVGVFSERDLLTRVAGRGEELLDRPVAEFMTKDPVTIGADAPLAYALHQMDLGGYRHLPVIDVRNRPVAMVSIKDILAYLEDEFLGPSDPS